LVQLTGEAFLSGGQLSDIFGGNSGFVHAFIAHEIGHEWWGHAVSWANQNDQWLSESYTEYCSALYVQSSIGEKEFEDKLRRWRDSASHSKDSGPIWLGSRLGKHYTTQTYDKGPYVLHMLRIALQAQAMATGGKAEDGDKMFFDSLKNFIEKFRNQNATTLDFQKVIKATAKVDMDWFFDQWFRGNNWLNLEFKYEVRPTEDGKFMLVASFRQPDKDNVKQMTVPMYIHLKDNVITRMIFVNKAEQVVQLKLPVNPKKVTLDDNKDLPADIKYN
jgi:aminopeptidase N